jgi:hypothetical protein
MVAGKLLDDDSEEEESLDQQWETGLRKYAISDFTLVKVIGKGSFGKVS